MANRAKMAAGTPLTDDDRAPWLRALHEATAAWLDGRETHVLACSALKATYRLALSGGNPAVRFVFLRVDPALLAERLAARRGHFFAPALLRSQLNTLEEPPPRRGPDHRRGPRGHAGRHRRANRRATRGVNATASAQRHGQDRAQWPSARDRSAPLPRRPCRCNSTRPRWR